MVNQDTIKDLVGSLKTTDKQKIHTYQAIVSHVDNNGVVWVNVSGSEQETPTEAISSEVKRGDVVTVEWRNNKLYIAGNYTNPSTGIERTLIVEKTANDASNLADVAAAAATAATESAATAGRAASVAQAAADAAQATANTKKRVFTVQPVPPYSVGDLWVDMTNGVQNGDSLEYGSDAYSPLVGTGQVGYMIVGGATSVEESVVYVCTFARSSSESYNADDWQLAATDDGAVDELREWFWHDANGAHVLGDVSGYRNDITSTGMKIMNTATEKSVAEFGASGTTIKTSDSGGNDVVIAHLGYGSGKGQGGSTVMAPYYNIGVRGDNYIGGSIGNYSIAEGYQTEAWAFGSHAEGAYTVAQGECSHASGYNTWAGIAYQTVVGKYNDYEHGVLGALFIVGNGTADNARSDAFTVDSSGNVIASGTVTDGTGNVLSSIGDTTTSTAQSDSIASNNTTWQSTSTELSLSAGTWLLIGSARFASNATGRRGARWYNVTASEALDMSIVSVPAVNGAITEVQSIASVKVTTASTLRFDVVQNSGSSLSTTTQAQKIQLCK